MLSERIIVAMEAQLQGRASVGSSPARAHVLVCQGRDLHGRRTCFVNHDGSQERSRKGAQLWVAAPNAGPRHAGAVGIDGSANRSRRGRLSLGVPVTRLIRQKGAKVVRVQANVLGGPAAQPHVVWRGGCRRGSRCADLEEAELVADCAEEAVPVGRNGAQCEAERCELRVEAR